MLFESDRLNLSSISRQKDLGEVNATANFPEKQTGC